MIVALGSSMAHVYIGLDRAGAAVSDTRREQ